jgi:hypothetical protein
VRRSRSRSLSRRATPPQTRARPPKKPFFLFGLAAFQ